MKRVTISSGLRLIVARRRYKDLREIYLNTPSKAVSADRY